ncbi:MAG: hypothetical protein K6G50_12065 [bacterium]|nr:hypothetical protein [bacterium]
MEDINNEETPEVAPPEVLDHLIDEMLIFAKEHDEHVDCEWDPDNYSYVVTQDDLQPVDVMIVDTDDSMYGELEAVVVEAEIGLISEEMNLLDLLRYSDEKLIYGRLAAVPDDDGDLLVVQAACPVSQLSAAQLDAMIREVAVTCADFTDEDEDE